MVMKKHTPFNAAHRPEKKKKPVDYYTPWKAFDAVMAQYADNDPNAKVELFGTEESRAQSRLRIDVERYKYIPFYLEVPKKDPNKKRGQGTVAAKGTPVKNPTAPNLVEFRMDVEKQIRKVIHNPEHMQLFNRRYIDGIEDLTKAEQHLFARYEQQIGRLFVRHQIWPLNKYFISIREGK
jgi:hypothetical protein